MHKLTVSWSNFHLRTKFLLILLLSTAIIGIVTIAALRIPMRTYDQQLYQSSSQMITLFAEQISDGLKNYEDISYHILTDASLQENLSVMKREKPGSLDWAEAKNSVANQVAYYSLWFSNTVSFQLKTVSGDSFGHFFGPSLGSDELTKERMDIAQEYRGYYVWLTDHSPQPRLFLVREIQEMKGITLQPLGYILIEVNFPGIVEQSIHGMEQMGIAPRCAVYNEGTCLYASDDTMRSLGTGEDGYTYTVIDGDNALCVRYTASNGMEYVTLVDYESIRSTTMGAVGIAILCTVAAMIAVSVISTGLINNILVHLQILLKKIDNFAIDGQAISTKDSPYRNRLDEIGDLHRAFDWMTLEWNRANKAKEEQQRLLQEKQIQQLRAQVRPHFLYNTLESIYCLAQSAGDQRIAVMTEALGKMLRTSLSDKRDVITVKEDLQFTRSYLDIQQIRYGERLKVEYDVPEQFLSCRIPSMTIQPLVENSIHHAAEKMLDTCVIQISAGLSDDEKGVRVIVEDNGPGTDEDILDKLESGKIQPEGLGIGMRNIHKRIQHAFSDEYGLSVHSTEGKTQIIVNLPDTRSSSAETEKAERK